MSKVIKADEVSIREESSSGPQALVAARRTAVVRRDVVDSARIVRQAKREAQSILARAQAEASRLIEEAERRLAQADASVEQARHAAREEGLTQGRKEGYRAGREEGIASTRRLVEAVERVLAQTLEARQALLEEAEEGIVRLALAVAEKLLCQEIEEGRAKAVAILRRLVPDIEGARNVKVRVAPASLEALGDDSGLLTSLLKEGANVELVADGALGPVDVVVDLEWGIIDARLQSRWRRVIEGLDLGKSEGESL